MSPLGIIGRDGTISKYWFRRCPRAVVILCFQGVNPCGAFSFWRFVRFLRPQGRALYLTGAQPPSLIFRGHPKFETTKPTSNINLASTHLCLVTAVTGGFSFVRLEGDMSRFHY